MGQSSTNQAAANGASSQTLSLPSGPCVGPSPTSTLSLANRPAPDLNQWFNQEVHPHDSQLRAWLRGRFPSVRDVDDVVQESYFRIWRRQALQPVETAKTFLFSIARNLALDLLRRERVAPTNSMGDLSALSVLDDSPGIVEQISQQEKHALLGRALATLPVRCRETIILHKLHGLSQAEVAARLGISVKTVENQVALGVKRCNQYLRRHGIEYI